MFFLLQDPEHLYKFQHPGEDPAFAMRAPDASSAAWQPTGTEVALRGGTQHTPYSIPVNNPLIFKVHLVPPNRIQLVSMDLTPQWLLFHQVNILQALRTTGNYNFARDGNSRGKRTYTTSSCGKVARLS